MKRRLRQLVLFLLLGAAVNVAVAWACALWINVNDASWIAHITTRWEPNGSGSVTYRDRFGASRFRSRYPWVRQGDPIPSASQITMGDLSEFGFVGALAQRRHLDPIPRTRGRNGRTIDARGVPYRSMWCEVQHGWRVAKVRGGIDVSIAMSTGGRILPLLPLWPGFIANTLFYAALLWLAIYGRSTLRWILRTRRNLCPACAYPVGTSPVCTECGAQVVRRSPA